ncbi:hypothetical protein SAMN05192558_10526 [Actinokineospora alba]|uniref:Uncharacterized protein n=1 Tax=Actinokineospora alba TaxID=504798 RepID=A0A1H0MR96_9PSEU|nr:hypothetical protein [Actinokineospora alba]TDP68400.1 hypothetical protein C8E96_3965 [Actinokineospora alba]SDH78282.1 hypothetical protein SAMN05421871_10276 [Actinokineospora alba]SDO82897.1 hypothetical protein SAMN05192558_10526 [Actinokineospora alba]
MLYIVLILVLAALGLLVTALTTANTLWAWLSVGISIAAAGLLVYDWLGNRRRKAAEPEPVAEAEPEPEYVDEAVDEPVREPVVESVAPAEAVAVVPETSSEDEPDEEPTDAADLLVISGLTADVRVLDERPRYHLAKCAWLGGRSSIGLPVAEARQLGFTPCARCSPDATLAAKHRSGRGARIPGEK